MLLLVELVAEFYWQLYSHKYVQVVTSHFFIFIFINGLPETE